MKIQKSSYMPELDVLRAFAFLAVFISHWIPRDLDYYLQHGIPALAARGLVAFSDFGSTGVMVFFCLSSYLITGLLLKEIQKRGHIDVGAFYMRRLLRIWPLYMVFTAIALILPYIDSTQQFGWKPGLAFLLFSGNWVWALGVPVNTVATPLWSISVEEQFYLCWPWVVRRATRIGLRNTAICLLVLATLNRILVVTHLFHSDLWHNTFTQFDSIALGALIALGVARPIESLRTKARGLLIVGAVMGIYLAQFFHMPEDIFWGSLLYYPFVSVCCATVLICFIGMELNLASLIPRTFVALGKISYGLYVFHNLSFYLVLKLFARIPFKMNFLVGFAGRGVIAMFLTIAIASASYRFLEQPFLKFKKRYSTDVDSPGVKRAIAVAMTD